MLNIRTLLAGLLVAGGAHGAGLKAGAARVEITPRNIAELPMAGYGSRLDGHKGVHDPLYTRAVAIDDGERKALLVSSDVLSMTEEFWTSASARIARDTGIPRERILLAATHTHGAPTTSGRYVKDEFAGRWKAWMAHLEDRVAEAARQAVADLRPARAGIGKGEAWVNTNRRARLANGGWGLGVNPRGVSDKTLAVVRFETPSGEPIALLLHYSVHGVVMGPRNYQITGDLPGETARLVERHYGGKTVAAFLAGASGDQNPIYEPGDNFRRVGELGALLAEEALRVAGTIKPSQKVRVTGALTTVSCPGRKLTAESKTSENRIAFENTEPAEIRLSLLMVGDIAFAGVSGEVLTLIGRRLQKESPVPHTLMVTHANGSVGYIADEAAYAQVSYEIWSSRFRPGCAENAIVSGFLGLLKKR